MLSLITKIISNRRNVKSDQTRSRRYQVRSEESPTRVQINQTPSQTKSTDDHERSRDFLNEKEMEQLLDAARKSRNGTRDYLLFLMMYRHGLRVSEAIHIKLSDLDLLQARLWVKRLKEGLSVEHPIAGDELRAIKRYLLKRDSSLPWLFLSERRQPMSRQAVNYLIAEAGDRAGLGDIYPHMLRHSCGFYLANKGYDLRLIQDYLGHRDHKHTVHYTRIAAHRFENLWNPQR